MEAAAAYAAFAGLALAGFFHCAGMCGGFAVMVAGERRGSARRLSAYVLGKTATYVILGAAVALASRALGEAGARLFDGGHLAAAETVRRGLALAVGAGMILTGLRFSGLFGRGRELLPAGLSKRVFALVSSLPPTSRAFGIGVLGGLLPCGLSFGALLLATQVDVATAVIGLGLFGLATSPALATVGLGAANLSTRARVAFARCAGPLLVLLGALTCVRGATPDESVGSACPFCTEDAQSSPPTSR